MPQSALLKWPDSHGWIVFAGGTDDDIQAQVLERALAGKPLVYLGAASDLDTAERALEALEDLGAPSGYLVDIATEDDETIIDQIGDAGIIIIGDGPHTAALRSGLVGAALTGITEALDSGAFLVLEGAAAQVFGGLLAPEANAKPGVNWLEDAAVVTGFEQADAQARLRAILLAHPTAYGLGIGSRSALALGPKGEIEAWGERQITVTIGSKRA